MPLILPGNVATELAGAAFLVANSCRFNDGDSPKLTRTFGSAGNQVAWTISMWVKRGILGTAQPLWSRYQSSDYGTIGTFNSDDTFTFKQWFEGSDSGVLTTNRVFRDCSAWYNIICVWNSGDSTAGDRMKLFINGAEETSFSTDTNPPEDQASTWNTAHPMIFGNSESTYFDGYLAEVVFYDGVAVSNANLFGEFDSDSPTIWKPIDVSELTPGTNGVYFDFETSGTLGNDAFGGTDWTATNLAAADQATDSPTNNFCVINPLQSFWTGSSYSEGNCQFTTGTSGYFHPDMGTFGLTNGKWYFECEYDSSSDNADYALMGIKSTHNGPIHDYLGESANDYGYYGNSGDWYTGASATSYGDAYDDGDIVGVYIDLDNNKLYFAKNGTIQASGTGISTTAVASTIDGVYFPAVGSWGNNNSTFKANFGGCSAFAVSSGNTDTNGYGNFEYDPSAGTFDSASKDFLAICSANLGSDGG